MYSTPIPNARTLESTNSPHGLAKNANGPQKITGTGKTNLSHFCGLILCVRSSYEEIRHRLTTYPRLRRPQILFRRLAIAERFGYH